MNGCAFEKLVQFLDKRLDLNTQLEVLDHLDRCDTCREAIYRIARDRDGGLFDCSAEKPGKSAVA